MNEPALIFGAALDYLDDPDRIGLKLAYLEALAQSRLPDDLPLDPYDVLAPIIIARANGVARADGKITVPGWLTPRPAPSDRPRLEPGEYRKFMDDGGIRRYVQLCRNKAAAILPSVPVMIGVDHALTAGAIRAAAERYGPEDLAVVVLDAHFDAIAPRIRAAAEEEEERQRGNNSGRQTLTYGDDPPDFISDDELEDLSFEDGPAPAPAPAPVKAVEHDDLVFSDQDWDEGMDTPSDGNGAPAVAAPEGWYGPERSGASGRGPALCGDFLATLLDDGVVRPEDLYVVGVTDFPTASMDGLPFAKAYNEWIERGVKVYPKRKAQAPDFGRRLAAELDRSRARHLYVSLDADVGGGVSMNAVRFLDRMGMTEDKIMGIARGLRELIEYERFRLAGLDVCEIEIHLLGLDAPAAADPTAQIASRFVATLLGNMTFEP